MVVTAFALSSSAMSGLCMMVKWNMQGKVLESAFSSGFPRATRLFSRLFSLLYLGYVMADLCYPSEAVQYCANLWFC